MKQALRSIFVIFVSIQQLTHQVFNSLLFVSSRLCNLCQYSGRCDSKYSHNGSVRAVLIIVIFLLIPQVWAQGTSPSITSVFPSSGSVGTTVTISGSNFENQQGTVSFRSQRGFGNVTAIASSWTDNNIVVTVPGGALTGGVFVTTASGASNSILFTVPAPVINSISPASGPTGGTLTLTGSNFGPAQQGADFFNYINFSGTPVTATSWSDSTIIMPVPSGAPSGTISVFVGLRSPNVWPSIQFGGQSSNAGNFVCDRLSLESLSPIAASTGSLITLNGSCFGTAQGSSTVIFNGIPATITSWSDTNIVASVPSAAISGDVTVNVNGQTSNTVPFIVLVNPVLSGQLSQTTTAVTLTSPLALDWEHWGTSADAPLVRMAESTSLISDLAMIGANAPALFSDGEVEYLWSDGDVLTTGERTTSGVSVRGTGNGFHLSVPADTTPRTLMLYVGVDDGQGKLTASLSDTSIAPFVDSSLSSGQSNSLNGTYAIDFRASQPGQTLNIDYVLLTDEGTGTSVFGEVSLQSVVLLPRLPSVGLTAPLDGQNFTYPATISATVNASQIVSAITKVDLFSDSQNALELTTAPYSFSVNGLTAGDHVLTTTATDANGLTANSEPVLVAEIQGGGSLSAAVDIPANIDISAGTTDWVHWGNPESANNIDRKAGIAPQISDLKTLANGNLLVADDASQGGVSNSWSGGVPTD